MREFFDCWSGRDGEEDRLRCGRVERTVFFSFFIVAGDESDFYQFLWHEESEDCKTSSCTIFNLISLLVMLQYWD